MMLTRTGTFVAVLLLLNALLAMLLAYEVTGAERHRLDAAVSETGSPDMPVLEDEEPVIRRALGDYAAMLKRPLFNQDRIPIERTAAEGEEVDASAFSLIGVVLTPEQQVAIIQSKNQGRPVKVSLWEWVDGWRLVEVEAEGVVLRKGNRSLELALQRTSQAESK